MTILRIRTEEVESIVILHGVINNVEAITVPSINLGILSWNSTSYAAQALGKIGDARVVEPLIKILKDDKYSYIHDGVAWALGKIGDARAVEPLIEAFDRIEDSSLDGWYDAFGALRSGFNNLMGYYIDLISDTVFLISGDFPNRSDEAINKLCGIYTQISNNILHLLSKKRNIIICCPFPGSVWDADYSYDGGKASYVLRSFESQRKKAEDELKRRGNPPYDPSVYLNKEAWKL